MADLELRISHRKSPKARIANKQWTRPRYNSPSPQISRYDRYSKSHGRVNDEPSVLGMDVGASNPSRTVLIHHEDRESVVKPLSERIAPDAAGGTGTSIGTVALGRHRVEPPVSHEVTTGPRLSRNQRITGGSPRKIEQDQSSSELFSSSLNPLNGLRDASFPEAFSTNGYGAAQGVTPGAFSVGGSRQQDPQRDHSDRPSSKRSLLDRIGPLVVQNARLRSRFGPSAAERGQRMPSTSIDHQSVEAALTPDVCASIVSSMTAASKQYAEMKRNEPYADRVHPLSEERNTEHFTAKPPDSTCPPQANNNHISRSPASSGLNQPVPMSRSGFPLTTLAAELPVSSGVASGENRRQEKSIHGTNSIILPAARAPSRATESSVPLAPAPPSPPVPISIPISPAFFINSAPTQNSTASSSKHYTHEPPHNHRRFSDDYKYIEHPPLSSYARPHKRSRSRSPSPPPSSRHQNDRYSGWNRGRPSCSPPPYHWRRSPPLSALPTPHQHFESWHPTSRHPKSPRSRSPEFRRSRSPVRQSGTHYTRHNGHYRRLSYQRQPSPPQSALPSAYLPSRDYPYPSRTERESSGNDYPPISPLSRSKNHFTDQRYYMEPGPLAEYPSRYNLNRSRRDDDRGREWPRPPIEELNVDRRTGDSSMAAASQSASATVSKLAAGSLPHMEVNGYPNGVDKIPTPDPVHTQDTRESEETVVQEPFQNVPGLWFMTEGLNTPDVFECSFEVGVKTASTWHLPRPLNTGGSESMTTRGDPRADVREKLSPTVSLKLKCLPAELVRAVREKAEFGESKDLTLALSGIPCKWPPRGKLIIEVNPDQKLRKTLLPKDLVNAPTFMLFNPTEDGQEDSAVPYVELNLHVCEGSNLIRFIQLGDLSAYVFMLYATPGIPRFVDGKAPESMDHETLEHDLPMANLEHLFTKSRTSARLTASLLGIQNPSVKPVISTAL